MKDTWSAVLAMARHTAPRTAEPGAFTLADNALQPVAADDPAALVAWHSSAGWTSLLAPDDSRAALLDLYLPICNAPTITVGHLGQSLDGFIATHAGESQYVTGGENILHLHRMRALSDAVVVGAGTVAADDPQLTTRLVPGPSPLRVVLDPMRRLEDHYRVFNDNAADTLYVCGRSAARQVERSFGRAEVVTLADDEDGNVSATEIVALLRSRGCRRIFVEGGGVTVSTFLDANLLDRLQIAIAPLLIGDGRPAIRIPARSALSDCHRPRYRVFRMGADVLFDCELGPDRPDPPESDGRPPLSRII